ncbi:jumonji protein [Lentinula guzmanii]|uniref:JmjC domain-containing histone demethylation protein 1 n=1 Tax=Lentinula guzmanii TaxID=2804957 RepID=A0AA38MX02_9AGAR|nr:jumonji protein [Lentinula guzmanii]
MASGRRSARTNGHISTDASPENEAAPSPQEQAETATPTNVEPSESKTADDRCPACTPETIAQLDDEVNEQWAMCGACKVWYHWRCAGEGVDLDTIDKWFCKNCLTNDTTGKRAITFRAPARKSDRKRTTKNYANIEAGVNSDPKRFLNMMEGKEIKEDSFRRMEGGQVGMEWAEEDENAMKEPIVIESMEGLGMNMPDENFTVDDVGLLVGEKNPIEVIDVASQTNAPGWTVGQWVEYYNLEPHQRDKIFNVISLEISGTLLADRILPPRLVRELDWVENFWPSTRKGKGHTYPKVQLYCLMGVQGAWTDWHVDFAGSSVYYHIMHGSKVFYFIKPTPANLAAYERWSGTEIQYHTWLGDLVDEVVKVTLTAGNTMIIPTGWIHAVYTPEDTLVFGGNFLHSYNIPTQLKVRDIEIRTQVPKKFRFPMFTKLCWYVGDKYMKDLKNGIIPSSRVLDSLSSLVDFLLSETRVLERGSVQAKKEAKEQIPHDRVKDGPALARELAWRLRHASGNASDDEHTTSTNGVGYKRKRIRSRSDSPPKFRNFRPKGWDKVVETKGELDPRTLHLRRGEEIEKWTEWDNYQESENEPAVEINSRKNVITKVRLKTEGVLERERIERIVEVWTWKD